MSTGNFYTNHYLLLTAVGALIILLAVAVVKKYRSISSQLKQKRAENKHLSKLLEEYQGDQTAALEHLTASKDKAIKRLRIQHAVWREDTRAKNSKQIEELKAEHATELTEVKKQLQTITELKWANAAMLTDLDKKHQATTAASLAEIEAKHQEAIQERHHQFESKRALYDNFLRLMDQFDLDSKIRADTIITILDELQRNYVTAMNHGNKKRSDTAVTVASKKLEKLWMESQMEINKIKDDMNSVLLVASEASTEKIAKLADFYDNYIYVSGYMLKHFVSNLLTQKTDKIAQSESALQTINAAIEAERIALMEIIKEEMMEA